MTVVHEEDPCERHVRLEGRPSFPSSTLSPFLEKKKGSRTVSDRGPRVWYLCKEPLPVARFRSARHKVLY